MTEDKPKADQSADILFLKRKRQLPRLDDGRWDQQDPFAAAAILSSEDDPHD